MDRRPHPYVTFQFAIDQEKQFSIPSAKRLQPMSRAISSGCFPFELPVSWCARFKAIAFDKVKVNINIVLTS